MVRPSLAPRDLGVAMGCTIGRGEPFTCSWRISGFSLTYGSLPSLTFHWRCARIGGSLPSRRNKQHLRSRGHPVRPVPWGLRFSSQSRGSPSWMTCRSPDRRGYASFSSWQVSSSRTAGRAPRISAPLTRASCARAREPRPQHSIHRLCQARITVGLRRPGPEG